MSTLQMLGIDIVPFDVSRFVVKGNRLLRSWTSRTLIGPSVVELNRAMVAVAKTESFDGVWIDKGTWVYPETVQILRHASRRKLAVHYTPDAQFLDNTSRHFSASMPFYDLLVTTKKFELDLYHRHGARHVLLVLQGFGPRHVPMTATDEEMRRFGSDVCFIGHYQRHYARVAKAGSKGAGKFKIWGSNWPRYAAFHPWARDIVQGNGVWAESYPLALSCSKIALGLLSRKIPETTTTRSFEIPATGVFMLAERNDEHLALFEEGKDAEFFEGDDELQDKIDFYLKNDSQRLRIAAAGRERSLRSGYSDADQLRRVIEHLPGATS